MEKLIDIAFSGFWSFIGVITIIWLFIELISNVFANICRVIISFNNKNNK